MSLWSHKFYEPKVPQTLHLRLYKSYAPTTLQNLWAQGPINFMNPKPHKWLYNPKAQKHLWAQRPTNIVNPRPHKFYEPKAPWAQYPTNCVNPTKSFAKRNVWQNIWREMFNKECLDTFHQTVSNDTPLPNHFGRYIFDQKCWGEPFTKTSRQKPLPKRFCLVEIAC